MKTRSFFSFLGISSKVLLPSINGRNLYIEQRRYGIDSVAARRRIQHLYIKELCSLKWTANISNLTVERG